MIEAVEVTAAALQVELRVLADPAQARAAWPEAGLRLVSTEVAPRWSSVPAGRAHLVGTSPGELSRCSAQLGLPVLPLPDDGGRLAEAMRSLTGQGRRALVISVTGASGGLGCSTLVLALAVVAAKEGSRVAAVDLEPDGGGLDLLCGAETQPGVRWDDLANARGELGELSLPTTDGVGVLAQSRSGPTPDERAVKAVLGALARSCEVLVLDTGRTPPPVDPDRTLLLVGGEARSVAAAHRLAERRGVSPDAVVVRRGAGRALPAQLVAQSLGLVSLGVIREDRAVPRLAELGLPPTRSRRYCTQVTTLWKELTRG